MSRLGGVAGLNLPWAPVVAGSVIVGFSLAVLAVLWLGLPLWSLLVLVGVTVYVIVVVERPVVGLLAVVCVFFSPAQVISGVSLLQLVGLGTSVLLMISFLYQRRTISLGTVLIPFFILGLLILASYLYTLDVDRTTHYFRKWVLNMSFALLLINMVTRFDIFKKVVWAVIVMASLNSVAGIVDFVLQTDSSHRSMGLLENANPLGHLAALAFPLALYQYLYRSGIVRWVGLAICGLLFGGVVVSVSRGAIVSLIIVFAVIMVNERRRVLPLILVVALILCSVPFLPDYFHKRVGNLTDDIQRSILWSGEKELTSRGYLNKAGLKIWLAHPIRGVGVGNFGYYFVKEEYSSGFIRQNRVVAHSIYTQALSEMGILGGAVLLWLALLSFRNLRLARRASRMDHERWVYFGAVEMMALSVFISLASYGSIVNSDFWLFICLTAASRRVAESSQVNSAVEQPLLADGAA